MLFLICTYLQAIHPHNKTSCQFFNHKSNRPAGLLVVWQCAAVCAWWNSCANDIEVDLDIFPGELVQLLRYSVIFLHYQVSMSLLVKLVNEYLSHLL